MGAAMSAAVVTAMYPRHDEGPSDGPAVVLLHGQPGSASDWARVTRELGPREGTPTGDGLRVIAVDRPGYGASTGAARDWAGNSQALGELLDAEGITRAIVVGWSWAGGVALRAALDDPDRIAGLVLIGSVGHSAALSALDYLLAAPVVSEGTPFVMGRLAPSIARAMRRVGLSKLDDETRHYVAAEARLTPATSAWVSFATEQRSMLRETPSMEAALPQIKQPVRILHGWDDPIVPFKAAGALATALPNATLEVVRGGHLLPLDSPAVVARVIREAVRETSDAAGEHARPAG
jgi:pimeloyl-ACP methyl ester carboxylesterase